MNTRQLSLAPNSFKGTDGNLSLLQSTDRCLIYLFKGIEPVIASEGEEIAEIKWMRCLK